jgi:hypothetical protein
MVNGKKLLAANDNGLLKDCVSSSSFELLLDCIDKKFYEVKTDKQREKIFSALIDHWKKRDGAEGYILSDIFLGILMKDPDFFFKQMGSNKTSFNEWVEKLDSFSFVWQSDSPSPLKQKKEKLIKILKKYSPKEPEITALKQQLLNRIQTIIPS